VIGVEVESASEQAGNRRLVLDPLSREEPAESLKVSLGGLIGVELTVSNDTHDEAGLPSTDLGWIAFGVMCHMGILLLLVEVVWVVSENKVD
jgi:hypothetical protein